MIKLPDNKKAFEYENGFYLTCHPSRMAKHLAHLELMKKTWNTYGAIVECGVFKGASLTRFAMYRSLFGTALSKKIIGFDVFGEFPETKYNDDQKPRKEFINNAGNCSISRTQLINILKDKGCSENVELVEGDVCVTVPEYIGNNPGLKISLLHLDVDIFEPSVTIMEQLFPRLMPGGILIIDDYERFPGETKAVDDALEGTGLKIQKFNYCSTPCYVVK
ncbi:TylF/MycF family methyltransferase [bacterium]|nr:TylF/MycF family methyltransferase [bacterium]